MTESAFDAFTTDDGVEIAFQHWKGDDDLPTLVLHHGFTGDTTRDWVDTGVVGILHGAGRTVVAPDARGHGHSGKPHREDAYGEPRMARDLSGLIDATGVPEIDLVGFSMGAVVSLIAATQEKRIRRLVTVGVGAAVVERGGVDSASLRRDVLADALIAEDPGPLDPRAQAFLDGLEGRDVDRVALSLVARSAHMSHIPLDRISAPTLVIAGDTDPFAQRPEVLSAAIPGARLLVVSGDHGGSVTNRQFTANVLEFLGS
ncbi:MAG TPA: alpha/beta fold hydrolase [Actinomycetes bacterium]|nr:alpha/beta fold hydrolase [Actinomycetes bacterium]